MVNIMQVPTGGGGGSFVNNNTLKDYPAVVIHVKSFEADYQNTKSKYPDRGLGYKLEDRLKGDFLYYDTTGRNVGSAEDALWASSKSTIRNLQNAVGQTVVIRVAKPGDYWNVYNVDGELLTKIIADLEAREAQAGPSEVDGPPEI